jgi:hypothetical protein
MPNLNEAQFLFKFDLLIKWTSTIKKMGCSAHSLVSNSLRCEIRLLETGKGKMQLGVGSEIDNFLT